MAAAGRRVGDARDRARGALLGLAAGDAVGTTLEFERPGSFSPIEDMVGGGPFRLRPGQWTDDTSMALCLAESILDTGGQDLADQLRRYLLWRDYGYLSSTGRCFDIGNTTTSQLSRFARSGEPVDPRPDQDQAANGSLMRLAPVPIRCHADPREAAEQSGLSSRTTHAAERPVDCCRVLGAMVAALIGGSSASEVFDDGFWKWGPPHHEVEAVTRGGWRAKEPPAIRGTGYCIDALEAAIWAVAGADDFRSAVLHAANLGNDADTTAAIAGQLAGARWGASGIPAHWRGQLAMRDRIQSLADNLFDARALDVEHERWRFDGIVHAWWVEPGWLLAGEYPGSVDGAKTQLKLDLLVDAGVRTFLDLTTAGELNPYGAELERIAADRALDLRHVSRPIPDLEALDHAGYDAIVQKIAQETTSGRPVYVHCWGGVGRTGTVVGCWLIAEGHDPRTVVDALAELRAGTTKARRRCPETPAQLDVLRTRGATGQR